MRDLTPAISVHQSALWHTNTGVIKGSDGALLLDPGVFTPEFEAIASIAGPVAAGFCTHAHWDHVLWHESLGRDVPRFASAETVALIHKDRDRILADLEEMEAHPNASGMWDQSFLFREQPMPWGQGSIAGIDVQLIPVSGHEDGQSALFLPDHRVCFVADTLSDVETPSFSHGVQSIAEYLQTLDRLERLIQRVDWIVPGHGSPATPDDAHQRLEADRRYLRALVPAVKSAEAGEAPEEIARQILVELDERRAESELAWTMHLENIAQLVTERGRQQSELPVRRSSRIILLDDDDRVWMLRINDPLRPRWILPGGGVEEGESWEDAARRELWEECAIDDAELGPMVATRNRATQIDQVPTPGGMARTDPTWIRAQERYFLVRLNGQLPAITNMYEYESADYTAQRWFSAEDIRASNELVYPIGLVDLLDQVRQGNIPTTPWEWLD